MLLLLLFLASADIVLLLCFVSVAVAVAFVVVVAAAAVALLICTFWLNVQWLVAKDLKERQPRTRMELSADYKRDVAQTDGDKYFANFRKSLFSMGFEPNENQIKFWRGFEQACVAWFYGDTWAANRHRVLKSLNVKQVRSEVLVMTPRREGKTWSICAFVLSMLLNRPGIRMAVFSTGKRASSAIMEICMNFIEHIPNGSKRICKKNQEQLFIAANPLPHGSGISSQAANDAQTMSTTSKLNAYPSAVDGKSFQTTSLSVVVRSIIDHSLVSIYLSTFVDFDLLLIIRSFRLCR